MGAAPTPGRLVSFTLDEVPLKIRRRVGRRLLDVAAEDFDVLAGIELNKAIEEPSDKVYRVSAKAFEAVVGDRS
jgi:hypothetical protein